MRVEIIAEAGLNHNGSLHQAVFLANAAMVCGADIFKTQTSVPELEATPAAGLAAYQVGHGKDQLAMIRSLVLSFPDTLALARECESIGIEFMSTPADPVSLQFLIEECGMKRIKIGSDNLTNPIMLSAAAAYGLPVILSTGMAILSEVGSAFGCLRQHLTGRQITLLQCTSLYPCPAEDANVAGMGTLKGAFGTRVGLSDHTEGFIASLLAVGAGACLLEKHLTDDRDAAGPDHRASLDVEGFQTFVSHVRLAETMMGHGEKSPALGEIENARIVRKSLVAARSIEKGEEFSADNLAAKRPGTGRSPWDYFDVLGKPSPHDYAQDQLID